MLTDDQIRSRRMRFGCCALDYLDKYIEASIHGDIKCARLNWGMYLKMWFAKCVMDNTSIGSESKCGTVAYATKIAKKYDCFCNCPCPETQDEDCVIDVAFTVIDAISFDDLPAEPEDGDNYLITEGDFTGRIATWQSGDDAQWIFSVVGVFNVVQTEAGVYYINIGNGPGLLFPSLTMELTGGPETWTVSIVNDYDTTTGRTIQLEGLGPNGWYAMWQGNENDLPAEVNLLGLPFTQVRLRYILANECQYVSGVGTTIPEIDDGGDPLCGTFDYAVVETVDPVTGIANVVINVSNVNGYPFGPATYEIDGIPDSGGLAVFGSGSNDMGDFYPGSTVIITITNSFDAGCNVVLAPIEVACGTIDVATEVIQDCDGDPPQWSMLVNITNNIGYVVNNVYGITPLGGVNSEQVAPGQWIIGPLNIEDNPGPLTIEIPNANGKPCSLTFGPFEPAECPECPVADAEISQIFIEGVPTLQVNYISTTPVVVGEIQWTKNGVPQTPIDVDGAVAAYNLGPLEFGDVIGIALTNEGDEECPDDRGEFTLQSPCEYAPYAVTLEAQTIGTQFGGETTDGYYGVVYNGAVVAIVSTGDYGYNFASTGPHCVYPCDAAGNPSGQWLSFEIADGVTGSFAVPDLSPLAGLTLNGTSFASGSLALGDIRFFGWTQVDIPALVGSSTSLTIYDSASTLTTVTIAPTSKFKVMHIEGASINSASVDALCNALDATATGQATIFSGTAAATTDSLDNRNDYIANGNTITFNP